MKRLKSVHRHLGLDSLTGEVGDIKHLGKTVWFTSRANMLAWCKQHPDLAADEGLVALHETNEED
jgi:hypothetical protein